MKHKNGYAELHQAYEVLSRRNDELEQRLANQIAALIASQDDARKLYAEVVQARATIEECKKDIADRNAIIARIAVEGMRK